MKDSSLPQGYVLRGTDYTYRIEGILGQGSFGITYLATTRVKMSGKLGHIETEVKVAVKEFFMKEFCSRHDDGAITEMAEGSLVQNYSRKFRKEAENLAKLSHPGIVKVLEVFDSNNTCYYSMEYIHGGSLDAYLKGVGSLQEEEALGCIRQIGDAVHYLHTNKMLHLDLKPGNVMRCESGGRMVLIDFGLSKQYTSNGEPESSTTIGLGTPGYAPLEQSSADRDKDFAPTLDVYALGATLFKMLTGETPPKASDVLNEGLPIEKLRQKGVSEKSIGAIECAMEPRRGRRLQDVQSFLNKISSDEEKTEVHKPVPHPVPAEPELNPEPSSKPVRKSFPKWLLGVIAGIVVVGVLAFVLFNRPGKSAIQADTPADGTAVVTETVPVPEDVPETPVKSQSSGPASEPASPAQPEAPAVIELTSLSLSRTTLELEEGSSATLTVKYIPNNATDKSTTWKSSDASVAKVSSSGKVTAVKSGNAAIIATCQGKDVYCNVTVKAKEVQPSRTEQPAQQTSTSSSTSSSSSAALSQIAQTAPATTGTHAGHGWVDLGLSVKWATSNVGAGSPEGYGSYFAWGETSQKSEYTWSNLKYCNDSTGDSYSKYNQNQGGTRDNRTVLEMSDDAAHVNWGGSWRMPTIAEFQELIDNCTWTWTTLNGKNGYKVTSKKNGNSIFLPAAGWRDVTSLYGAGSDGSYWSSSLYESLSYHARGLYFNSGDHYSSSGGRRYGQSVRPVMSSRLANTGRGEFDRGLRSGRSETAGGTGLGKNSGEEASAPRGQAGNNQIKFV